MSRAAAILRPVALAAVMATFVAVPPTAIGEAGIGMAFAYDGRDVPSLVGDDFVPGFLVFVREGGGGMCFDWSFNWYDDEAGSWFDWEFWAAYELHPMTARSIEPFVQIGAALQMHAEVGGHDTQESDGVTELGVRPVTGLGVALLGRTAYLRLRLQYQGPAIAVPTLNAPAAGPLRILLAGGIAFDREE